jgi:predicted nucleotidyltransferase
MMNIERRMMNDKARFGAHRVILFGSLAHGAWPAASSDVDLAVAGLSAEAYWRAWPAVEEQFPDRPVDLVALETATGSLRSAIQRSGIEL